VTQTDVKYHVYVH